MTKKQAVPVSLDLISITDGFWKERMELVRTRMIPYQWEALNDRIKDAAPSHCISNFEIAAGKKEGTFEGAVFQDSDVYKWLEAVAWQLMQRPDEHLMALADYTIDLFEKAQQPDGYLDTYYILTGLDRRFTNLMDHHELYCLGHMVEAAVAYFKATGKRKFLDIAARYADCVDANIGPQAGKKQGYPGHEVAEMALCELYRVTGKKRYLDLARYFIDQRGTQPLYFEQECREHGNKCHWENSYGFRYYQAGEPVRSQEKAEGHAVRAVYLYSGMAEVASLTEDETLLAACRRLMDNIEQKQLYITGSIGATAFGEAFTFDYDLPNDTVYGESCAAIGLIFFARRMFELTGESRYADIMERALYNGVISGMSLDGQKFFYVNPLEVVPEACEKDPNKRHVKPVRQKWFGCACCPPNIARLLSSVGSYAYERGADTFYLNLFIGGRVAFKAGGASSAVSIHTDYPWDGEVTLTLEADIPAPFTFALRIPGWCDMYTLQVNGTETKREVKKGYALLSRTWKAGDVITLNLSMPVRLVSANPKVREDIGKVALMRGPLVYCLEEADNGAQLQTLSIKEHTGFALQKQDDLPGGIVTVTADGSAITTRQWKDGALYKNFDGYSYEDRQLTFIPYFAWANRTPGEMTVWVRIAR